MNPELPARVDTPRCEAWVGLSPPDETADCELDLGHDGVHEGTLNGSVRDRTGAYQYVPVTVRWAELVVPDHSDGESRE